jgi:hypothetical protein
MSNIYLDGAVMHAMSNGHHGIPNNDRTWRGFTTEAKEFLKWVPEAPGDLARAFQGRGFGGAPMVPAGRTEK